MLLFQKALLLAGAMKRTAAKAVKRPEAKKAKISASTARATEKVVHPKRLHVLHDGKEEGSVVAYWMSRDQRVADNWALLHAQQLCELKKQELVSNILANSP